MATVSPPAKPPPTSASSTTTQQPLSAASRKPVDILPEPAAQLYTNLHPILLLSLLTFSFASLVRDPINTLLGLAPTVAILQAIYCVTCLPSSGSAPATSKPGQKKKPAKPVQDVWAKVVPTILSLILTLTLSTPLLFILTILFGAPIVSEQLHTLLFALHLALLTTPPLFYVHGLDAATWQHLVSLQLPLDEISGTALGALVGAWLGAVPIPLDWDRDWQRWPVTVVTGLYLGAVVGKVLGGYVCKGLRMKLN